jgi:hypothetical protein
MTQMGLPIPEEPAPEYPTVEPVTIRLERHHEFVPPAKKPKRGHGLCRVCKRAYYWIEHHGFPEPFENDNGEDPMVWQPRKKMWQTAFAEALHATSLPRGCERMMVHVEFTFENRQRRDRDNLVYPFCKFLGDTLVRGRYFEVNYADIDWDQGPLGDVGASRYTWKIANTFIAELLETDVVEVHQGRKKDASKFDPKKPVQLVDPLGGWIPDDRWDRFEVVTFSAVYKPGVMACEIMFMPDLAPPGDWPPAAG